FQLGGVALIIGLALALAPASHLSPSYAPATTNLTRPALVAACGWLAVVGLSLPDFVRWAGVPDVQDVWDTRTSRMQVLASTAAGATDGRLLLTDACIDPQPVKVVSAVPVAYYRLGMAWPQDKDAVDAALDARDSRLTDAVAARANIGWILTDSGCGPTTWLSSLSPRPVRAATAAYEPTDGFEGSVRGAPGEQSITLWHIGGD
ncbi:MAG: hypothetical protein ACLGHZ_09710, partial [Actinomycetes bacterium]